MSEVMLMMMMMMRYDIIDASNASNVDPPKKAIGTFTPIDPESRFWSNRAEARIQVTYFMHTSQIERYPSHLYIYTFSNMTGQRTLSGAKDSFTDPPFGLMSNSKKYSSRISGVRVGAKICLN